MNIIHFIIPIAHAQETTASTGGIATLGLNVKFFVAQLVNFGILLLIFWKWILPSVTKALQDRTAKIQKSLTDADQIAKDKQEFEKWKNEQIISARQEAGAIISKSQADANKVKDETLQKTKDEQQKLVQQAKNQIEDEKLKALQSAKGELADLVTNATEKMLRQKLDKTRDEELIKEMLNQIK